ncbi:MAG: glutamyl-tRNA reductase [Myxococcales bacterium]|nr:glutamyl-tRNA reductase [Myxococcales bacterium]
MGSELIVLGISHRTAPVAVRECLAVDPADAEGFIKNLSARPGVGEVAFISTCNRVEIYAAVQDRVTAFSSLRDLLVERLPPDAGGLGELETHLYRRAGRAAVHHLFRVASSLDSLVVGEPQILGQVKDAFDLANRAGVAGPTLVDCFTRAFRIARRIRRDTGIARQSVSVSSVAVDLARQVFAGFEGRQVLLVGAGKMADLAGRALKAQGARVAVTNRTRARAEDFANRHGFAVEDYAQLEAAIGRADIVITSTGARQPILGRDAVARIQKTRRSRSLVLVDIAVPRDVDPAAADVPGVYLWDIDDLQKEAATALAGRREEAEKAEQLVEEEVLRYLQVQRGRGVAPTITALRNRFQSVAQAEAEKALAGLPGADERTRRAIERLATGLANKLLHAPQVVLKKEASGEVGEMLAAAVAQLFELPAVAAVQTGADPTEEAEEAPAEESSSQKQANS